MKVGNDPLNYVQVNADGSMENATRQISASLGVMTAFNRVGATWTGGCYPLITGILRNEWNFKGFIITDAANDGVFMDPFQMIEAGADAKLTYLRDAMRFDYYDKKDPATFFYGRNAIHRILYTIANSNAMNGAAPGATFKEGMRMTAKVLMAVKAVVGLLILWILYSIFRLGKPSTRMLAKREKKAAKKAAKKAVKEAKKANR